MLPPIFTQVDDPSTLTKPGPYSAHELTAAFGARNGIDAAAGLSGLWSRNCCADTDDADNTASTMTGKNFRIRRFYRGRRAFATGRI
jgi:hypothetical protein